jgi:hypothetical protein
VGALRTIAAQARAAALRGPTIIIVGTVVGLRDKLNWFAATPARAEDDVPGADARKEAPREECGDA